MGTYIFIYLFDIETGRELGEGRERHSWRWREYRDDKGTLQVPGGVMCSTETGCNCVGKRGGGEWRVCVRSMRLLKDVYIGVVKGLIRGTQG